MDFAQDTSRTVIRIRFLLWSITGVAQVRPGGHVSDVWRDRQLDPRSSVRDRPGPRSITVDHEGRNSVAGLVRLGVSGVPLDCVRPGKPIDNALIESCKGRQRDGV
jgi:hypothetical protein